MLNGLLVDHCRKWVEYPVSNASRSWMIKSATRRLPAMIASAMLLFGPSAAGAGSRTWEENGQASWYGAYHQGRPTSRGEPFDQNAMTAAHANLPLGSRVRVTRRDTGKSVVVVINDRQPPKGNRVIDLSRKSGRPARYGGSRRQHGEHSQDRSGRAHRVCGGPRHHARRRCVHQSSATWSATYAPRAPIGRGGPLVLSRAVCSSSSAFSSAPSSTA